MKILFNLHKTGLANNGGSRTLIKSAETLANLGEEVYIYSPVNNYTWHDVQRNVHICKEVVPPCDVAIATTPKNVDHTMALNAKRKFYYIRGYEVFWCPKELVHSSYRKIPCIVNSEWLQGLLAKLGVESKIVYPGLDMDLWKDLGQARNTDLGGLHSSKHPTKRHHDIINVSQGLSMLLLNRDIKNPSPKRQVEFYNDIKVWMAPTELEGLHNPPMEASLCGCALVCTNHKRSGMSDYAIPGETALVYPARNLGTAKDMIRSLLGNEAERAKLVSNMKALLSEKISDRKKNMKKLLEIIGG